MRKTFIIIIFLFINFNFLQSENFIIIKGKPRSFKEFNKCYLKTDKIKNFHNNFKIIKNNHYHFIKNNSFSFFLPDPYEKEQTWLNYINAKNADEISMGKGILVGILDSGVELDHEDLKGQIIDYFNVADNNSDVTDYIGHGTSVTGIMAAIAHNGNGIIGLAPEAKYIMAKIAHDGDFTFDDYSVAKGIYYLVDKGCQIINMSIQMTQESEIVDDAIEYAKSKGVILVAATGNNGKNEQSYPASNPYVLGVGSVDEQGNISNFSNYDNKTFIFAIGKNILTTYINNDYIEQTGTSFSAPMLTALIADILSLNNYLTIDDLKKIIKFSVTTFVNNTTFGILNFNNSLINTGIKISSNKDIYHYGDSLTLKVTLPPMTIPFNLFFGIITPEKDIYLLQYKNQKFYWSLIQDSINPTFVNINVNRFLNYTIFGDNGIFQEVIIDDSIKQGKYKFCGTYEKDDKLLGYFNCKDILIIEK